MMVERPGARWWLTALETALLVVPVAVASTARLRRRRHLRLA